ncbi:hypothetical protein EJB05_24997 [Eragrostis curvula]|uniref:Uncharacterized protein n=1 Tax=Eragrostis curvula TaxID=38414 RepID=A0A5J9VCT5_9POAL|nr:hypothetical protein EJB05_24997 [Eragrostis curvula]
MAADPADEPKCYDVVIDEGNYLMARVMAGSGIMATMLVFSGLFHSVLRRMGQPSVISHILAGIVVGPTLLGRVVDLRQVGVEDASSVLLSVLKYLRVLLLFFIGIELDLRYLRHNLRRSVAIACGGSTLCLALGVIGGPFFYGLMHPLEFPIQRDKLRESTALFAIVLISTASPVLIRIVTELKLTGSETGQLAIGAAFANDMASVAALSVMMVRNNLFGEELPALWMKAVSFAAMVATAWGVTAVTARVARLLNRLSRGRRYISAPELCFLLLLVSFLSEVSRWLGYSATMAGFLIGLNMPREGPTARTIVDRLGGPVHRVLMPIFFGAIGARLDFRRVGSRMDVVHFAQAVVFVTLLSAAGNVVGTVVAGRALGVVTAQEGVVLGFLLNVKGYADILAINFANAVGVWGEKAQAVLLLSSIVNTFMAGPAAAAIVRQQRRAAQYQPPRCLQDTRADHDLRVLACVHAAAGVHSMLALADLSNYGSSSSGAVYLLHLVELVSSRKYTITHHLYQFRGELGGDDDDDVDDWGSAREIDDVAAAVSAFTNTNVAAALPVRQTTAISSLDSMDTDVCNAAEDARASLLLVPFRKDLRYDGRMVCRREGRRQLNQRVLQRAPCTVGVLAERRRLMLAGDDDRIPLQVAALFLGGPDDREAVAYAARLAAHPLASVTVCRLLPAATRRRPLAMATTADEDAMADEEFMADLHARLVVTGQVAYTETHVGSGAEMADALRAMAEAYSLIVLGRSGGGAWAEEMTRGLGECCGDEVPELGPIGELLASDEFRGGGSVLALQQHSVHKTRTRKQEEQPPQQSSSPPSQC